MSKQKLTTKKEEQRKEAQRRGVERLVNDEVFSDITIDFAKSKFILYQMEKGNSKQTIAFYERFFKKFYSFLATMELDGSASVSWLTAEPTQLAFVSSLGNVNQQTVNSYLRGYRAFGNYCEEAGLIDGFHCPIKEVEPPAKEVYTDKELQKLLVKPDIRYFNGFRDYTIINLILATGARTNTILNIKIKDVELDEGYITYNTTKAHKVVRLGLERKCKSILQEYISYWRKVGDGDITAEDYLFCNIYGEQLTRGGLSTAIARYNREHGVYKTSIHLFRHTFAKKWITSGGDIITLSRVLTHSELDMVKRYSNLYGYDVKEEIEEHSVLAQLRTHSGETLTTKKRKENGQG